MFMVSDVNSCHGMDLKSIQGVASYPVVALKKETWRVKCDMNFLFYTFELYNLLEKNYFKSHLQRNNTT